MLIDVLVELSSDPDPEIRAEAIDCLRLSTDARMIEPMKKALLDENEEVRGAAAENFYLLTIRDRPDIVERLEALLNDPSAYVRRNAALALMSAGTKDSSILLQRRLKEEKDSEVRDRLEGTIKYLQERATAK